VDLQQFALKDQVPMVTGLNRSGCVAPAPRPVTVALRLHQLGKPGDQLGDPPCASSCTGGDGHCAIRPAVDKRRQGCNPPTRHVEQSLVTQISGDGEPMFNTMANRCIH